MIDLEPQGWGLVPFLPSPKKDLNEAYDEDF